RSSAPPRAERPGHLPRRPRKLRTWEALPAAAVRCSAWFGGTLLIPNRHEPQEHGLATAGLPDVNDLDTRVLPEPGVDLLLEGMGILFAVPHRRVLPEELDLHQRALFAPNATAHLPRRLNELGL